MTTNPYITFVNSNSSLSRKFHVVMGTLQPVLMRTQNRRRTLTGRSDNQLGGAYAAWAMVLLVHAGEDLPGYGLLADLLTFWGYNSAVGVPSSIITFIDHLGVTFLVEFVGNLSRENLTPLLDGPNAHYLVPISMEQI